MAGSSSYVNSTVRCARIARSDDEDRDLRPSPRCFARPSTSIINQLASALVCQNRRLDSPALARIPLYRRSGERMPDAECG